MFIEVPNTAMVELRGTLNGEPVENTLYFHRGSAWDLVALELLATSAASWYLTGILPVMSNEYSFREAYVVDLTTQFGLQAVETTGAGTLGGYGSDASSNQSAFCVKFTTGRRGRSYRGRNYVPAVPEQLVDSSKVTIGYANAVIAAYSVLLTWPGLFGLEWSVVSRYAAGAPRDFGVSTLITGVGYTTLSLATQRGRRAS